MLVLAQGIGKQVGEPATGVAGLVFEGLATLVQSLGSRGSTSTGRFGFSRRLEVGNTLTDVLNGSWGEKGVEQYPNSSSQIVPSGRDSDSPKPSSNVLLVFVVMRLSYLMPVIGNQFWRSYYQYSTQSPEDT